MFISVAGRCLRYNRSMAPPSTFRLDTPHFKQSKMMCGPASLKIVAQYFGIHKNEREFTRLCKANRIIGTSGKNLVRAAKVLGFTTRVFDDADFGTIERWIRKGVPVIVNWMSPGQSRPPKVRMAGGHYSVVCGLNRTHIVLEDPGLGYRRTISRKDFMTVWFDFDDIYLKKRRSNTETRDCCRTEKVFLTPSVARSKSWRRRMLEPY